MEYYKQYMDRQQVCPSLHARLLALAPPAAPVRRSTGRHLQRLAAACACCALVVGAGGLAFRLWSGSAGQEPPAETAAPSLHGFPVAGSDGETQFIFVPYVAFPDVTDSPGNACDIAVPDGAFSVDLTEEQVSALLWGGARPEGADSIPWMLLWEGFTVTAEAWYDGTGALWQVALRGERDGNSFSVALAPEKLPPTCVVNAGAAETVVNGVTVSGWSSRYDLDGDGVKEVLRECAFLTGKVGVRAQFVTEEEGALTAPQFINWCTRSEGSLSLDHLLTAEEVPAFRSEEFSSYAGAREEAPFLPYLPAAAPEGYGDFYGNLVYQEGREHFLLVRWSRGYDDVRIIVRLPEGGGFGEDPVDGNDPAAYDVRLYPIPWCDSVPAEQMNTLSCPTFRREDLSRAVIAARELEKDTGGSSFRFRVLCSDGTLVEYDCSGLTVDRVWAMVQRLP